MPDSWFLVLVMLIASKREKNSANVVSADVSAPLIQHARRDACSRLPQSRPSAFESKTAKLLRPGGKGGRAGGRLGCWDPNSLEFQVFGREHPRKFRV